MKVALVIERVETWRGGAETSTMQFAGHLARLGCEVHVVTGSYMPSTPDVRIVPVRVGRVFKGWRTGLFAHRAARYVREAGYDIVHAITPCPAADIYQPRGGTVPEMLARNLAVYATPGRRWAKHMAQRLRLKYHVLERLERRLLSRRPPPIVIAISDYVTDQLRRHYRFDPAFIRKIFNGVDPDQAGDDQRRSDRASVRRQYGLTQADLVLLCVAHNFKLKGVARAIEALRVAVHGEQPTHPDRGRLMLVIVGRDNPTRYARLANQLGVNNRVIFAGATDRPLAFFHAADILIHPTYYDPCSRVVLEALAAGLPVITTRFNGAAERIEDGRHGYVVDSPDDVTSIAARIRALSDAQHRLNCAHNARAAVAGISMRDHARHAYELYRELAAVARQGERGSR